MRSQAVSVAESEQFSTLTFPDFEDIALGIVNAFTCASVENESASFRLSGLSSSKLYLGGFSPDYIEGTENVFSW